MTRRTKASILAGLFLLLVMLAYSVVLMVQQPPPPIGGLFPSAPSMQGIWLSQPEIQSLPMQGAAWQNVKAAADGSLGRVDLSGRTNNHDVRTLAVALVYARTRDDRYRAKAAAALRAVVRHGLHAPDSLSPARNIASYPLAADLIDLQAYNPQADQAFRAWLKEAISTPYDDGRTVISTHEDRPNNWGTMAGASRIAADVYLGDKQDLARAAEVFRAWTCDPGATYTGFKFRALTYQENKAHPCGINPGNGAMPEEEWRHSDNYPNEGLQGALMQAELLYRAGYDSYQWGNKAILRAAKYNMAHHGFAGDDLWMLPLLNARYGQQFEAPAATRPGKVGGWTDWTAQARPASTATGATTRPAVCRQALQVNWI
jgi:Alginate lyase